MSSGLNTFWSHYVQYSILNELFLYVMCGIWAYVRHYSPNLIGQRRYIVLNEMGGVYGSREWPPHPCCCRWRSTSGPSCAMTSARYWTTVRRWACPWRWWLGTCSSWRCGRPCSPPCGSGRWLSSGVMSRWASETPPTGCSGKNRHVRLRAQCPSASTHGRAAELAQIYVPPTSSGPAAPVPPPAPSSSACLSDCIFTCCLN